MSREIDTGGRAFPVSTIDGFTHEGMSLRDYFAGQALVAFMTWSLDQPRGYLKDSEEAAAKYARAAYIVSDAMITESKRT